MPFEARIFWVDHGFSEVTFVIPTSEGKGRFDYLATGAASESLVISGGHAEDEKGRLAPPVRPLPPAPDTKATRTWTGSTAFVCAQPGSDVIEYLASVSFEVPIKPTALGDPFSVPVWGYVKDSSREVTCGGNAGGTAADLPGFEQGAKLQKAGEFELQVAHQAEQCPGYQLEYVQRLKLVVKKGVPCV